MSEIYEQVRAMAEGRDYDEEAIREWLSENSGESSLDGIWVSNAKLRELELELTEDRDNCVCWLEDMTGFTAERAQALRDNAPFQKEELAFLCAGRIQSLAEDHELNFGQYVSLVEFKKSRRKSVWLLSTSSGGGWGIVEREIFDAFYSAEDAIASLRQDGYTDL
ncbi:MAG: hypothetical protein FJ294_03415 [Planctomycetes bacterium]|nr:hypothetical protein [Planctomycetota bacterium]MBM3991947.1 hypothetical protein [Planctomycetota bacterium]